MRTLFLTLTMHCLGVNASFAAEENIFYCEIDQATGDVINKIEAKQQAIKFLRSNDFEEQELGANIIAQISPLGPNPQAFFQDITLLINSNKPTVYDIGITAIKKYIEDNGADYRPEVYTWIERYPWEPGETAARWIKLLKDIGDDKTVYPEARQHIAKNLNHLKVVFQEMKDDDIRKNQGYTQEEINEWKEENLLEAQAVAAKILRDLL